MASFNATTLSLLQTAYVNIVSGQMQSYALMGKTFTLLNIKDLSDEIDKLTAKVNAENGMGSFRTRTNQGYTPFYNPFRGY